jgi:hypothetical protein
MYNQQKFAVLEGGKEKFSVIQFEADIPTIYLNIPPYMESGSKNLLHIHFTLNDTSGTNKKTKIFTSSNRFRDLLANTHFSFSDISVVTSSPKIKTDTGISLFIFFFLLACRISFVLLPTGKLSCNLFVVYGINGDLFIQMYQNAWAMLFGKSWK